MKRRDFIAKASLFSASFLYSRIATASQACNATMSTPIGAIQRCTAGVDSFALQSIYRAQAQKNWCWVACISMVFHFYGHRVSQERIVQETWGAIEDLPGSPRDIMNDLNRSWHGDDGETFSAFAESISVSNFTAVTDLQGDHPLIIGALGHATVLTALTGDTNLQTGEWDIVEAVIRDPWPESGGKRVLTPQEWSSIQFAARIRIA